MTLPTITDVSYFLAVHEEGSLSKAAEKMGIRQSSMSMALKRLEEQLGTHLFVRSKGTIMLTSSGRSLVERSRGLLLEWQRMADSITAGTTELAGRFVISAYPTMATYMLPRILGELLRENPRIEIKLVSEYSRNITQSLLTYQCDFGLVSEPTPDPRLERRKLASRYIGLWRAHDPNVPTDIVVYDSGMAAVPEILRLSEKAGARFRRTVEVADVETVAALVANGAGIGVLSSLVATRQQHGPIEAVFPRLVRKEAEVYLLSRKENLPASVTQYLFERLCSGLKEA